MATNKVKWHIQFEKKFKSSPKYRANYLNTGVSIIDSLKVPQHKLELYGQPYDSHLLHVSEAYKTSRIIFLKNGGQFLPAFITPDRNLLSEDLVRDTIEYSPLQREFIWAANSKLNSDRAHIIDIGSFVVNIFHEQNHRILWKLLPPPPKDEAEFIKFMYLSESLVVATDLVLARQVGGKLSDFLFLAGVIYHPNEGQRFYDKGKEYYQNYLYARSYATYLMFEGLSKAKVKIIISDLYKGLARKDIQLMMNKTYQLNKTFISKTSARWIKIFRSATYKHLGFSEGKIFGESSDPYDNQAYEYYAKKWFKLIKAV